MLRKNSKTTPRKRTTTKHTTKAKPRVKQPQLVAQLRDTPSEETWNALEARMQPMREAILATQRLTEHDFAIRINAKDTDIQS